jgi:methyl-accepting chemotaxis protein
VAPKNTFRQLIDEGVFDELFNFVENIANQLGDTLFAMAKNLPDAFADINFDDFIKSMENVIDSVVDLFKDFFGDIDLSTKEGLEKFIQRVVNSFTSLNNVVAGILDAFGPFIEQIGKLAQKFADMDEDASKFAGNILGWGKAINSVAELIPKVTGALNLLSISIGSLALTKIPAIIASLKSLAASGTIAAGTLSTLGTVGLLLAGSWTLGKLFRDTIPGVEQMALNFQQSVLALKGLDDATINTIASQAQHTEAMGLAAVAAVRVKEALGELPSQKTVQVALADYPGFEDEMAGIFGLVENIPDLKEVDIKAAADTTSFDETKDFIIKNIPGELRPDGTHEIITEIIFNPDKSAIDEERN